MNPLLQKHLLKSAEKYSPTKKQLAPLHIAIAGNIGAGKTTLATLLAKTWNGNRIMKMSMIIHYSTTFTMTCNALVIQPADLFLNSAFRTNYQNSPKRKKNSNSGQNNLWGCEYFLPNLHAMGLMTHGILTTIKVCLILMNNLFLRRFLPFILVVFQLFRIRLPAVAVIIMRIYSLYWLS